MISIPSRKLGTALCFKRLFRHVETCSSESENNQYSRKVKPFRIERGKKITGEDSVRILCSGDGKQPSIAHSCSCDSTGEEFVKKRENIKGHKLMSHPGEGSLQTQTIHCNAWPLTMCCQVWSRCLVLMQLYRGCHLSPVIETLLFDRGSCMWATWERATSLSVLCITCRGHSWSPIPWAVTQANATPCKCQPVYVSSGWVGDGGEGDSQTHISM